MIVGQIIQIIKIQLEMSQKKLCFIVEWFDPSASIIKQFYFSYYLPGKQIQMYDIKNHKNFLKKIVYPEITIKDLFIGNVLICYTRQLKIVDFGDDFTRKQILGDEVIYNKTYGMIKPNAYLNIGKIIKATQQNFNLSNLKMFRFQQQDAQKFYGEHQGKPFYPKLIEFITSDYVVGMELLSPDAINKWRKLIGPTNSVTARTEAPNSLRALYGEDGRKNAVHGSDSPQNVEKQLFQIFSSKSIKSLPYLTNCSLCIIKPHIVKSKNVGQIIDVILQSGFEISAMQMIWFDMAVSQQFYEVYQFLPECKRMIEHLASGPAIALEIRQENVVENFRKLCGPFDPQIAKKLQPKSLRGRFGIDRVRNAIHCTDLPEDGALQVQYIFQTLLS